MSKMGGGEFISLGGSFPPWINPRHLMRMHDNVKVSIVHTLVEHYCGASR